MSKLCRIFPAVVVMWSVVHTLVAGQSVSRPPGSVYEGRAFEFYEVRENIYHAVGTGKLAVGSNASIVINSEDVLVVDSHLSPAAALALTDELTKITLKPIRYVINTHFHFDHAHGNQLFSSDVEIIGHEFTYSMLADGSSKRGRAYETFVESLPGVIDDLKKRIASTDDTGEQATLKAELTLQENYKKATDAVMPTPPTMTLSERLTLHRGGREIQLLFLGRGHTEGDVVVYLPDERIVITGDLLTDGIAYLGDSHPLEWVETLDRLKKLDFVLVLPGHGMAFEGKNKIRHFQAYLQDFWVKVQAKHSAGTSAADAAMEIDMRNHAEHYPSIQNPGVILDAVLRAYDLLGGQTP